MLDLSDAFFCIPVHPDSQYLFAFEDLESQTLQLSWTVFPQGFRDSPQLFGQALSKDMLEFSYDSCTLLQYVDDLLLCTPSEDLISQGTTALLNVLAPKGYKISKAKAQMCPTSVKYLSLIISEGTRALGADRICPISTYLLPK